MPDAMVGGDGGGDGQGCGACGLAPALRPLLCDSRGAQSPQIDQPLAGPDPCRATAGLEGSAKSLKAQGPDPTICPSTMVDTADNHGLQSRMFTILQSGTFQEWMADVNREARARIDVRIRRAELGNLGDVQSVGKGVSEMRINYGPGYRVYFTQRGQALILLLCGGDKGSQKRDIKRAQQMVADLD